MSARWHIGSCGDYAMGATSNPAQEVGEPVGPIPAPEDMRQSVQPNNGVHCASNSAPEIRDHQEIFAACGTLVGKVDRIDGLNIKLEEAGSGKLRLIPITWVAKVDDRHIDLNRDFPEVRNLWQSA